MTSKEPLKAVEYNETRNGRALNPPSESSEVYKVAKIDAALQFTAEETILLRGLAKGNSVKQIARLLRLPRESLFRVLGDLRSKTGMLDDGALAAWALRNVGCLEQRSAVR